jgi:pyrimidine operon attenuation protein/uracil phosphoribosyltransferase
VSTAREILSAAAISRALTRIASEIVERNGGVADVALVGIRTRGVPLAERLKEKLAKAEGVEVASGVLDITLWRDDIETAGPGLRVQSTQIGFRAEDKTIILVDDVLHTGRTVRAALDALVDLGRPRRIQLAVLVDRGHRELPIQADYVGKSADVSEDQEVLVRLRELDGTDRVTVSPREVRA